MYLNISEMCETTTEILFKILFEHSQNGYILVFPYHESLCYVYSHMLWDKYLYF